ncbi:hypothetical protein [Lichenicoccus sp.]|uniref:hypothetical protein n=1 Tax=Lichenicoccus sp. TaxID=2781899 RepID=UPI003D0ABF80
MFKRALLHIGFEKTGSTSVQVFLTDNIARLRALGYFVPRSLVREDGFCNHTRLVAYALADHKLDDDLRLHHGVTNAAQLAAFRETTTANLAEEAAAATGCGFMLLSNEHLSSRVTEAAELANLQALLATVCEQVTIFVYLRNQADLLQSAYNEAIKVGFHNIDLIPDFANKATGGWVERRYFEYGSTLALWAETFGQENIMVRLFEPDGLLFGDVVQDLLFRIHVDPSRFTAFPRANEGLDASAQHFLKQLNGSLAHLAANDAARIRERVIDILMQERRGTGRKLTASDAAAFVAQFEDENESVRRRWFPDRPTLFRTRDDIAAEVDPPCDDSFRIMTLLLEALL